MLGTISKRSVLLWLLSLFIGSGCAALIYEVVWLQLLELVIGSSGVSLGVLLGTFMGGMCLGSILVPRLISPQRHPLRVYALLEVAIGIIGIMVLMGIPYLTRFYENLYGHGVFARALIAAICLLPPTLLMGATLPVVARYVKSTPQGVFWTGLFYGGNIAGAVAGCLLAGFLLLRIFDMPTATFAAAAINFSVAVIAIALAKATSGWHVPSFTEERAASTSNGISIVYLVIAMSGLSALGAQVVWTRLLSLLLGATVYSFSIILGVFLFGLGIGSNIGALLARKISNPRAALGVCQMLLTATIAWGALIISKSLPYWPINPGIYTSDWGPWYMFQLDILRVAWMVLPATILWGASFPLAIAAASNPNHDAGRMVGAIYAANTLGAILGALGFSMLVIPQIGTQWAQRLLILIAAISGFIAFVSAASWRPGNTGNENKTSFKLSFSGIAASLAVALIIVVLIESVSPVPWPMIAWGRFSALYMAQASPDLIDEKAEPPADKSPSQWYCTYVREGMNTSVAITKSGTGARFFHAAGKVQASTQPQDMRLQRMLGHLSVLARRNPETVENVLVIGCGAGVTAGTFLLYPNIKNIVICDIEPLVPKVIAPMFGKENYHVVDGIERENPRLVNGKKVTMIYDDGRHYLRTLPGHVQFDVITSDPVDPWVKGSAALNTIEFYEMCRRHLKPGGVMSLWIPMYESNLDSAKSMIATFFHVFKNGMIFSNDQRLEGYDGLLLGHKDAATIDVDALQQLLDRSDYQPVKHSLLEVGFSDNTESYLECGVAVNLLATYAGRASDLQRWIKNAQINRDRNLRLQYLAGMYLNTYLSTKILQNILVHYRFPRDFFSGSETNIRLLKQALARQGRREIHSTP